MKHLAIFLVVALLVPCIANAQARQSGEQSGERKLVKIIVGGALLAVGAAVVANSGESRTVQGPIGETNTSSFSRPQLVTGLAIAGTGGIVLWSALRRPDSMSTLSVGATAGKARAVFVRKTW